MHAFLAAVVLTAPAGARDLAPTPFAAGEELTFEVSWLGIVGGTATMRVEPPVPHRSTLAYRITTRARSSPFFSRIFPVDDTLVSWWDAVGLHSLSFEKRLREGKKRSEESLTVDPERGLARFEGRDIPVPPRVQDTLSAFFYLRTLPLEPGREITIPVHAGGKNYTVRVDVLGRERIRTPFGPRDAIKVEPHQEYEGVFDQRGRLWIWISDDPSRMPLLMKSSLPIGSIVARLVAFETAPTARLPQTPPEPDKLLHSTPP